MGYFLRDPVVILLCAAYTAWLVPELHLIFLRCLTRGRRELDAERYTDEPSPTPAPPSDSGSA